LVGRGLGIRAGGCPHGEQEERGGEIHAPRQVEIGMGLGAHFTGFLALIRLESREKGKVTIWLGLGS